MPLFRLTPIKLDHGDWRTSTIRSPVVVRAKNENSARYVCQRAFGIGVLRRSGEAAANMAWLQKELAVCRSVMPTELWPEEGPTAILDPEIHDQHLADKIAKIDD